MNITYLAFIYIRLAKFDYQKVALQNINIIPKESFAYPSEIFYFLKQANT